MNKFSDWTEEEFEAILTYQETMHADTIVEVEPSANAVPIDWRTLGAVQAIKDQGSCGSCWSFSAVSAVESAWEIAHGTLFSLSEQQLVDCHVCDGCNGGSSETAFVYYQTHYAMTEASYPYKGVDGTCQYNINDNAGVETTGYSTTTPGDINEMQSVLAQQPIAISIYVNLKFQLYQSGIFNDINCPTQSHNHAVNIVGWGRDSTSGLDYWILRNSWGTGWGESGYMNVQINQGPGICGCQSYVKYPHAA